MIHIVFKSNKSTNARVFIGTWEQFEEKHSNALILKVSEVSEEEVFA